MKKIIVLHKKEGETPLIALEKFRKKYPKYQGVSLTYAGRLDPMASGVLLILAGDKIKEKEKYLALDKEYQVSILFGITTDTDDILGKVTCTSKNKEFFGKNIIEIKDEIEKIKNSFLGRTLQEYPMYSSKTVNGVPLFEYARRGQLVKVPTHNIFVKKIIFKKLEKISNQKLFVQIKKRIGLVKGDFRQKEILKKWKQILVPEKKKLFFGWQILR